MATHAFLFTSPTCPHCPAAKRFADEYFSQREDVEFQLVTTFSPDGQELAQRFQVQSVPTFVIVGDGYDRPIGASGTPGKAHMDKLLMLANGEIGPDDIR